MRSIAMGLILSFRGTSPAKNKPKYDMVGQIQVIPCAILLPLPHKIITKKHPLKQIKIKKIPQGPQREAPHISFSMASSTTKPKISYGIFF